MSAAPVYPRPDAAEYPTFYAGYVNGMAEGNLLAMLESQIEEIAGTLGALPDSRGDFAYAPGKWTLKEVVGHIADAERIFSYRALRIARGDETPLPGFDEKAYVPNSGAGARSLASLVGELRAIRASTQALLRDLPADSVNRKGTASGGSVTVRAIAWIIAGHAAHHFRIIRDRYL